MTKPDKETIWYMFFFHPPSEAQAKGKDYLIYIQDLLLELHNIRTSFSEINAYYDQYKKENP